MSLQSLAEQQRQAILARERAAGANLTGAYKATWQRILARLQLLFAQMDAAEQHGQTVNLAWLAESNRLQGFLGQLRDEIASWASNAQAETHAQVLQAQRYGQEDARVLLENETSRLELHFNEPQAEALDELLRRIQQGPIAKRFDELPDDAVTRASKTLLSGVNLGWGPDKVARQLQQDLGIELNDALRISRTEMMQAYRSGTLSIYRANDDVVEGWEWLAEPDACPECLSQNGSKHSLDEEMDTHPNCRCCELPIVLSYAALGFPDITDDEEAA